ncbi:MAG: hypothetical protein ACK5EA_22755, partial [Planctomycetaceae bacterium]
KRLPGDPPAYHVDWNNQDCGEAGQATLNGIESSLRNLFSDPTGLNRLRRESSENRRESTRYF